MRLTIRTPVNSRLHQIKEGFTEDLFLSLNPPFPSVRLLEFGGCSKGDRVALELDFFVFKQHWTSEIVEDNAIEGYWYFIDVGIETPFFLKKWQHRHEVQQSNDHSLIIDDIKFSTGTLLTDLLLYPVLFLQFLYRKPIYKRRFSQ